MIDTLLGLLLWWAIGAVSSSFLLLAYESVACPREHSTPLDQQNQKDIRRARNKFSAIVGVIAAFIYYIVRSNRYIAP